MYNFNILFLIYFHIPIKTKWQPFKELSFTVFLLVKLTLQNYLTIFYITTIDQYLHTAKAQQSDPNCQIPACEFSIIFDPLNNEFHYHISTFLYL